MSGRHLPRPADAFQADGSVGQSPVPTRTYQSRFRPAGYSSPPSDSAGKESAALPARRSPARPLLGRRYAASARHRARAQPLQSPGRPIDGGLCPPPPRAVAAAEAPCCFGGREGARSRGRAATRPPHATNPKGPWRRPRLAARRDGTRHRARMIPGSARRVCSGRTEARWAPGGPADGSARPSPPAPPGRRGGGSTATIKGGWLPRSLRVVALCGTAVASGLGPTGAERPRAGSGPPAAR